MEYYCGIDLGSRSAQVCIIDEQERRLVQRKVRNELELILELLARVPTKPKIVIESTFNWYWLVDGLQDAGYDVRLAHVLGLALITGSKVKTDKRDAFKLAHLLRINAIPEAFIYPREWRSPRDLARRRLSLVRKRADEFGCIRRLLLKHRLIDHTKASAQKLGPIEFSQLISDPMVRLHAEQEVIRIELFSEQIAELEEKLLETAAPRDDYRRLQTLPGVSTILGLTILYETGPIERFNSARNYSSYCRVVSGIGQSGTTTARRPRQSKQGNPFLKWAFNQAATHAVRHYPKVQKRFDKIVAERVGRAGKVVAYNTIAHKLAVAAFHIMRDGTEYREEMLFGG